MSEIDYIYVDRIGEDDRGILPAYQARDFPLAVVYELPVFIRYEVFGRETTWEDTLTVLSTPDGWRVRYWGVTQTTEPETITRDEYEFTINGIAVMPDQILLVMTPIRPTQTYKFNISDESERGSGRFREAEFDGNGLGLYIGRAIHPNASSVAVNYWVSPSLGTLYEGQTVLPLQ